MHRLEIVSRRPETQGQKLVPYTLDKESVVGAFGEEPYAVRFVNGLAQAVEVRLSLDGTDLLTGVPATLDPTGKKWFVQPFGTLELKAWPESERGGAAFVFTAAARSVATHTTARSEGSADLVASPAP